MVQVYTVGNYKVEGMKVYGWDATVFSVWAPVDRMIGGSYQTYTTIDGETYGRLGTERLTPELEAQRRDGMLKACQNEDTVVPCHEWMDTKTPVVCRGLFNQREVGPGIAVLQIAERLGFVVYDDLGDGPGFGKD